MHSFPCQCGHTITVDPPSQHAGYIIWDSDADASIGARCTELNGFLTALATGHREAWLRYFYGADSLTRISAKSDVDVIEDILSLHDTYTRICYRCEKCGRLYLQGTSGAADFQCYRPEES